MSDERICVGALAGAFGVQGEVRLKSFCADPQAIGRYGPLFTEDGSRSFTVKITRTIPNGFSARVSGVTSKEAADALRGLQLFADRARLPNLPDDEFYHTDLIGLAVFDTGGVQIGKVLAVHNHGAGDILEVFASGQKSAMLLPFTRAVVPLVDLTAGRVVVDPPEEIEP